LIYSYYTSQPPRRVSDVYVLEITQQTDLKKLVSKTNNYIIVNKQGKPVRVVYNAFKTSETYDQQTFKLDDVISDILKDYIETENMDFNKKRYLFANDHMTLSNQSSNFSNQIQKLFNTIYEIKDANGKVKTSKGVSVDIIREMSSSFYVKKYGLQPDKLEEVAYKQGHSIGKIREYAKNISFESDTKIYEDVRESGKQEPKKEIKKEPEPEPAIINETPTTRRSSRNK
jgi:Sec-independent protein translocase protein TatA